ncbi:EthD family reductase [Sphingomonas sp. ID0503]|uniref:EthD family reductase n=1 Tax=Sphingomonas sp. ID0503 TaxID=3399691 RepID=UPI003AFB5DAD
MTTIVQVMYPPEDTFDWDYYLSTHMPMVEREMKYLRKWSVLRGIDDGVPKTYGAIAVLTFDNAGQWAEDFATVGPKLLADIPMYTKTQPAIQVSDVVE